MIVDQPVRLLIADDHPIFREGLVRIIGKHPSFDLVGQASDGHEALDQLRSLRPDVGVLDVEMPKRNGIDVARTVYREGLPTDIILLTMHKDPVYFNAALDLGVRGYLLKESVGDELIHCLTSVAEGQYYISPSISHLLVERKHKMAALPGGTPALSRLTPAERTILRLLAENLTSREIAERLDVSTRTVENHRLRMSQKLEIAGHHKLLQFALEHRQDL